MNEAAKSGEARPPLVGRLWRQLRPYRAAFALALSQVLLLAGLELAKPWPLKIVVDVVLGGGAAPAGVPSGLSPRALLVLCCVALVAVHVAHAALTWVNNRTTITIGQRMVNDLRSELYQHLQRLSLSFHANRQVGDLLYRLVADTYSIQTLTMNGVFPIANALVFMVGMTVVLARLDGTLTLVALGVCPVLYLFIDRMSGWISEESAAVRELESGVYSTVQHGLSAIRVVQAFTQEETEHRRFLAESGESLGASRRLYLLQTLYSGIVNTMIAVGTALVLWIGAGQVLSGAMSVGDILVFLSYVAALYAPISSVSHTFGLIHGARAGMWRVVEILEERESVASGPRLLERDSVRGDVELDDVSFSYDGRRDVVSNVSLRVPPASSLALVGPTGAGKTTLVSLLARFYDPRSGAVRLDGVDLRDLELKSLRRSIAMVLQPPIVFSATLGENIAYGRPEASRGEIEEAARLAQLGPFLERLPAGLETRIGEGGATLSEGERQRITIARALLRDAPILILDEPTASVDAETEALLMAGLRTLMRGRTVFIIAHRLSTVRDADRIVVLRDGRVAEQGSYGDLVRRGGFFAELIRHQTLDPAPAGLAIAD